jgi:hypothetical protein
MPIKASKADLIAELLMGTTRRRRHLPLHDQGKLGGGRGRDGEACSVELHEPRTTVAYYCIVGAQGGVAPSRIWSRRDRLF